MEKTIKKCIYCKENKEIINFYKDRSKKDGISNKCKSCKHIKLKTYKRTINGLVNKIYNSQIASSKYRKMGLPNYSLEELKNWIITQPNFNYIYNAWIESGYEKNLIPSIDRIDNYKGYSFDNIKLTTWILNKYNNYSDIKKGINTKTCKAVIQLNLKDEILCEHYSIIQATRNTKINQSNIALVCKGLRETAGGYKWKYKNPR